MHLLNTLDEMPLRVESIDVNDITIDVVYKKVYVSSRKKMGAAFLLEKNMRVLDLLKKAGGFWGIPENARITVHRNIGGNVSSVVHNLLATDPAANVALMAGDHVLLR